MTYEEQILEKHSTPGLRRGELSRNAKKEHLADSYKFLTAVEREELLDKLYPPQPVRRIPRY